MLAACYLEVQGVMIWAIYSLDLCYLVKSRCITQSKSEE